MVYEIAATEPDISRTWRMVEGESLRGHRRNRHPAMPTSKARSCRRMKDDCSDLGI